MSYDFWALKKALRVFPAETRLTVYRQCQVPGGSSFWDKFFILLDVLCVRFAIWYFSHQV